MQDYPLSDKKLTMKHPWADKLSFILLAIIGFIYIIFTYFIFTTEVGLELKFQRAIVLPMLLAIIALLSKFWLNVKSIHKIKKHLHYAKNKI